MTTISRSDLLTPDQEHMDKREPVCPSIMSNALRFCLRPLISKQKQEK